ncbi:MAG: hypothetical protein BZY79_04945 [SAR202 cluster bacterium Casp-Chloro-G4]|nr:adenylate kinase [Chloroflexota bacterium]MDA1226390.1 adenylate kinase [Chloroflexota bacterium]PKB61228.1 MAG: hypothetical protein BZY79_04945 [SAR202 cluster bacterium Casp-Chloro-G4]
MHDVGPQESSPISLSSWRIVVVGTSGAGKTTLAKFLAGGLGILYLELDALYHGPNWTQTPDDLFREMVKKSLRVEAWVVDGNYHVARDILWSKATTLVWLDYSFHLVFWRVFRRTMLRAILRQELWNGNREKLWRQFFRKDSLLLWVIQTHWKRRESIPVALAQPEYAHLNVLRFKSPRATKRWLAEMISGGL